MPFDGFAKSNPELDHIGRIIDLIDTPSKWCKGALRSHDGRYCIKGAIRHTATAIDYTVLMEARVLRAMHEAGYRKFRRVESFNDHPTRTHDEVIMVLERVQAEIAGAPLPTVAPPPSLLGRAVSYVRSFA